MRKSADRTHQALGQRIPFSLTWKYGLGHLALSPVWRRVLALPPVSPVFSNPFRVDLSQVSLATQRLNAYAATSPVDRTTGRRRSARRWLSVSNAWLPRFRETQHNRKM